MDTLILWLLPPSTIVYMMWFKCSLDHCISWPFVPCHKNFRHILRYQQFWEHNVIIKEKQYLIRIVLYMTHVTLIFRFIFLFQVTTRTGALCFIAKKKPKKTKKQNIVFSNCPLLNHCIASLSETLGCGSCLSCQIPSLL